MVFAVSGGVWEWVSGGGVVGEFCYVVLVGLLVGRLLDVTDIRIVHEFVLSYTPYFHIVE